MSESMLQKSIIPENKEKEFYSINEAAEFLSVHEQTLRNWERHSLIKPMRAGTRRIYTKENLEVCERIKAFSGKGVPLKGIAEIIKS